MSEDTSDIVEQLEAEAMVADASIEELTVVPEGELEEKETRVDELESEVDEKEARVDELESEVDEKEDRVEELESEISEVVDIYAGELADASELQDKEDFAERYDVSELREKYEALQEKQESKPDPDSGDVGASVQSPEGEGGPEEESETVELSEQEQVAADAFEDRGGVWSEIADDIKSE